MIDESVFIVDIGSSSAKLGYSGEDVPSYVLPSVTSKGHKNLEVSIFMII